MLRMLKSLLVAAVILHIPCSLAAESSYWVSVGSFKTELKASKTAEVFEKKYSKVFSVIGSDTKKGLYFRVVMGPFGAKSVAQRQLAEAKNLGLAAAWLWFGEARKTDGLATVSDKIYSDDLYEELENYKDKYDIELPLNEPLDNEAAPDVREYRDEKPAEIPPGFQLNKLRREASN